MAKKVKRKPQRGQKVDRSSTSFQKASTEQNVPIKTETVEDSVVGKEKKKVCLHFNNDINLEIITSKISSAEHIKCEDCKVCVTEKKDNKGKGKQEKKKGDLKSQSKAIWVCLECGGFYCGGVGFPTVPQSHAAQHAKKTHHKLFFQYENLRSRWCFSCNILIPVQKKGENGEFNDPLLDIGKVIKGRSTDKIAVNVEDVWFGSGSIPSEIKSENTPFDTKSGYLVRGLVNLGNTCFFNSILQNLLALDGLRDHYLKLNKSAGPLTVSFKKMYIETISESGLRNGINPRSFFGCICSKAPQFKGFQQHDSHELLRVLLDGLCMEELNAKKRISRENGTSIHKDPTFIDSIFGGQLSSTVSCLDCGHSSKVFEPFLDLSLSVPTKRPSSKKANKPISRPKKQKPPPKRKGKYCPKISKDGGPSAPSNISDSSFSNAAPLPLENAESVVKGLENNVDDSMGQNIVTEMENTDSSNHMAVEEIEKEPLSESVTDDLSWLDYLEHDFVTNNNDTTSTCNDIAEKYDGQMNESVQESVDSCSQVLEDTVKTTEDFSENMGWLDFIEPSEVVNDHDMVSKVEDSIGEINQSVSGIQSINTESNYFPENSIENEQPLQVQGSEVILLPYKEETSATSLAIGCEPELQEFSGFGDLFNEPEIVEGPSIKQVSSESDPDEVDNSNSQVSIESCLAYFIKPELLSSSEHGWNCENCSKALQEQKMKSRKKYQKIADKIEENGDEERVNDSPTGSGPDSSCLSEVQNTSNGNIIKDIVGSEVNDEDANSGKIDPIVESDSIQENSIGVTQIPNEENVEGITSDVITANELQENGSQKLAEGPESEENSNEEINSESLKVKRDATKRIFINKAPSILTIHLNRFCQDGRGRLSKLNGHVDFKDTIDLRPYMDPRSKDMGEYKYRLSGVVEHSGTMRGGHYIAYIRDSRKSKEGDNSVWYYAGDAHIRQVSLQEVLNCEAYILFYEKI